MSTTIKFDLPIADVADRWERSYRTSLSNVRCVSGGARGVLAEATDGRILAVCELEGELNGSPVEYVPAKLAGRTKTRVRKEQGSAGATWVSDRDKITPYDDPSTCRWPKRTHEMFPVVGKGFIAICLDSRLLAKACAAIAGEVKDDSRHHVVLFIDRRDTEQAVGVLGKRGIAVVMPCSNVDINEEEKEYSQRVADFRAASERA